MRIYQVHWANILFPWYHILPWQHWYRDHSWNSLISRVRIQVFPYRRLPERCLHDWFHSLHRLPLRNSKSYGKILLIDRTVTYSLLRHRHRSRGINHHSLCRSRNWRWERSGSLFWHSWEDIPVCCSQAGSLSLLHRYRHCSWSSMFRWSRRSCQSCCYMENCQDLRFLPWKTYNTIHYL